MHKYKELKLWQKSIDLVTRVYALTRNFPQLEKFGLVSQINRSAVSIPSNIAEGAGRNSDKEFVQFLAFAHASSYELETQLIISNKLEYISSEDLVDLTDQLTELQKMNFAIQLKLKQKI
ncbi:MAG: four helix bundle protein [Daejeonella sp.]|uniref:four helix bundle protein n=1 Tax=Daejeonella sp. JGW-45 TaxID=3034148 RepID=UPI0023EB465F|nr:four helix bundle protein [Daejeonella sp. JGW-45]